MIDGLNIESELAICEAASKGPWRCDSNSEFILADNDELLVAELRGWGYLSRRFGEIEGFAKQRANGDFIAHAREHYPALLRAHQRLRELMGDVCRVSAHRQGSKDIIHLDDDGIFEIRTILGLEGKS